MKIISLLLALLALSACKDKKAEWDMFMQKCIEAEFTPPQCVFLFTLSEKAHTDSDNAALLGVAVGTAVSSGQSKR